MVVQGFGDAISGIGADRIRLGGDGQLLQRQQGTFLQGRIAQGLHRAFEGGETDSANGLGDGFAHRAIVVVQGAHQCLGAALIVDVGKCRGGGAAHRRLGIPQCCLRRAISLGGTPGTQILECLDAGIRVLGHRHLPQGLLGPLVGSGGQQGDRRHRTHRRHRIVEEWLHVHGEIGAALRQPAQGRDRLYAHFGFRIRQAHDDFVPGRRRIQACQGRQNRQAHFDITVGQRLFQVARRFRHLQIAEDVRRHAAHSRIRIR